MKEIIQNSSNHFTLKHSCLSLSKRLIGATAFAALIATLTPAQAAATDWVHSSGSSSWFLPSNWSAGVPGAADDAYIGNDSTAFIEGSTIARAGNLFIDDGGVTIGNIDPGNLAVEGELSVGTAGAAASLNLNYGSLSVNTLTVGLSGSYSDTPFGTITLTGVDPTIRMANGVNVVINSKIYGSNGLNKGGLGTLTLANDNEYSGGTTISAGTLQVGNGGTTGSLGDGDVLNNGSLVFKRSDDIVVDNNISGTGNVKQSGGGKLTLTSDNTYSGGTTIESGTVQVGDGGTTGSLGSGNITNNSKLVYNRSNETLVNNNISGSGSLAHEGTGTLILTGNNTYAGMTTITNGTLQVGNGGTTGTLGSGNVTNNGALVFDRSDSLTVSNYITGSGSLAHVGDGTLILTADNNYTGITAITNGTLQVGNGGGTGSLGTNEVYNYGALVFNRSNSLTVSNIISGTGSVTQAGTNSLTLAGTNTYSGGTFVENGGTLIAQNNQALGTGDVNVNNGTLKMGNTSATNKLNLQVGGNYTQGAQGTLQLTIGGTISNSDTNQYDRLDVTGAADLDGTLHIVGANNYRPHHNDEQVILTADGGVENEFTSFTNSISHSPLINPKLVYNDNDVRLAWEQLSFIDYLTSSNSISLTANQTAVGSALDSIGTSTNATDEALIGYLDYLSDLTNSLPVAFDMVGPEELTAMMVGTLGGLEAQGQQFLKRANDIRTDYRGMYTTVALERNQESSVLEFPWDIYFEPTIEMIDVGGDTQTAGYDLTRFGFSAGLDRKLNSQLVVGVTGGFANTSGDLAGGSKLDINSLNLNFYGVWMQDGLHLEGMVGGTMNSYDTKRQSIDGVAEGSPNGFGATVLAAGGYDWQKGSWKFGPQLAVQYSHVNIGSFTEEGSLAPLRIESQTESAFSTQLGGNFKYTFRYSDTWTFLSPEFYFGWRHHFTGNDFSIDSRFASGEGNPFTVDGPELGSDSIIASIGLNMQWNPAFNTAVHLSTQTGRSGYTVRNVSASLKLSF